MSSKKDHFAFFRQSGWLVIATNLGGFFMLAVHTVARKKMGAEEYSTFVSLLRLMIVFGFPAMALQGIFARQAAAATNEQEEEQLRATVRAILSWTFLLWVIFGGSVLVTLRPLSRLLAVSNPAALYFTVFLVLTNLWIPIGKGLLQGKHQFGGLGWLQISDGLGRFGMLVMMVLVFAGKAASGMFAVVIGQLITAVIGAILTRGIWQPHPAIAFKWRQWFGHALPLVVGLGTVQVMSSLDMLFVQGLFPDKSLTALYAGAMLTGFAIIQVIAPVALVMFARVARNVARAERTDSLGMTLAATILFGCIAAIGCTLFPKLPLRFMYFGNAQMLAAAPLVPWFAWALLPLTVANVLVQNILAQSRFNAVPWLLLTPVVYAAALCLQAGHLLAMEPMAAFVRVIQTLGAASLFFCALGVWFSWPQRNATSSGPASDAARSISGKASSQSE